MTSRDGLLPPHERRDVHVPDDYVPVQQRILDHLREQSGAVVDAYDVAERIGTAVDTTVRNARDALKALTAIGLVEVPDLRTATLTEDGWLKDALAEPDAPPRPRPAEPPPPPAYAGLISHPSGAEARAAPVPVIAEPVAVGPSHEGAETRPTPALSQPAAPVRLGVQQPKPSGRPDTKKGKEAMAKSSKKNAILTYIRSQGGIVKDDEGRCASVIRTGAGIEANVTNDLAELTAFGLITRTIRGKRTYVINLTAKGVDAAIAAAKGATNGDVQELRSGDRVVDDGERKGRPARRKARAPARAKASVRRNGEAGAGKRTASGRRGHPHGDGARVDEPLRDMPGSERAPQEPLVLVISLRNVPPRYRRDAAEGCRAVVSLLEASE